MRARNTSPALMWRSEAPRSTAALMIFSMPSQSVARSLVDDVAQGPSRSKAIPVVDKQLQLASPISTWRRRRDVWREEQPRDIPKIAVRREWLPLEHIEHCSGQAPVSKALGQGALIEQGTSCDIDDDSALRKMVEPLCRNQCARLRGRRCSDDQDVGRREKRIKISDAV